MGWSYQSYSKSRKKKSSSSSRPRRKYGSSPDETRTYGKDPNTESSDNKETSQIPKSDGSGINKKVGETKELTTQEIQERIQNKNAPKVGESQRLTPTQIQNRIRASQDEQPKRIGEPTFNKNKEEVEFTFTSSGIEGPLDKISKEERQKLGREYVAWKKKNLEQKPLGRKGIEKQTASFSAGTMFEGLPEQQSSIDNDRASILMEKFRDQDEGFSITRHGVLTISKKHNLKIDFGREAEKYQTIFNYAGSKVEPLKQKINEPILRRTAERQGIPFDEYMRNYKPQELGTDVAVFGDSIDFFQTKIRNVSDETKSNIGSYFIPIIGQARFITEGVSYATTVIKYGKQKITGKEGEVVRMIEAHPYQTIITGAVFSTPIIIKTVQVAKASLTPQSQIAKLTAKIKKATGKNYVITKSDQVIRNGKIVSATSRQQNTVLRYDLFSRSKKIGSEVKIFNSKGVFLSSRTQIGKNIIQVTKSGKGYSANLLKIKNSGNLKRIGEPLKVSFGKQKFNLDKEFSLIGRVESVSSLSGGRKGFASLTHGGKSESLLTKTGAEFIDTSSRYSIIGEAVPKTGSLRTKVTQKVGNKVFVIKKIEKYKTPTVELVNSPVKYTDPLTFFRAKDLKVATTVSKPPAVEFVTTQRTDQQLNYLFLNTQKGSSLNPINWGKAGSKDISFKQILDPLTALKPTIQAQKPTVTQITPFANSLRPSAITLKETVRPIKSTQNLITIPIIKTESEIKNSLILTPKDSQIIIQPSKTKPIIDTKKKSIIEIQQEQISKPRSKILTATKSQQKIATIQQQKPIVEQVTQQITRPQTIFKTVSKPRIKQAFQPTQKPSPFFVPPPDIDKHRPQKQRQKTGFNVFVRRRGIFNKVNMGALSFGEAKNLGASIVGTTSSATFKLEEDKGPIKQRFRGRGVFGDFYKKGKLFIEKRGRRIKSSGELREITFKGIASKKRKRGIFGG